MSKPDGPSLLDEFFSLGGGGTEPAPDSIATPLSPGADGARRRAPPPESTVTGTRRSAPPPPPSLRSIATSLPGSEESDRTSLPPPKKRRRARSQPPPPPSKRRTKAIEPVSVSGDVDGDQDDELGVSVSIDEAPAEGAEAKSAEATTEKEETPKDAESASDSTPRSERAVVTVRSEQRTVPGLSPADEIDHAWDAISSESRKADAVSPTAVSLSEVPLAAVVDATEAPARLYADVPTPVVPIDFAHAAPDSEMSLHRASAADHDEPTVVRAEGDERVLERVSAEHDEETVVRSEKETRESERVLEPVSASNDEQTVVRVDVRPLAEQTSPEVEAVTDPFAAPPPKAPAAPPPRIPIGTSLQAPAGAPSLPPPPSFDGIGVSSAPRKTSARPM